VLAGGGCSGSLTQSDQVIVRLIGVDVDGARPIAQAECTRRGAGQARFVTAVGNASGARGYDNPDPPDAVFTCERR
jgi:hypothetical protein